MALQNVLNDHTSQAPIPKVASDLFDYWQHFSDIHLEAQFRSFALEDCRQKILSLDFWATLALAIAWFLGLIDFLNDKLSLWLLGVRLIQLASFLGGWLYCRFPTRFWKPWYVFKKILQFYKLSTPCYSHDIF